jgi:hypothetical protein
MEEGDFTFLLPRTVTKPSPGGSFMAVTEYSGNEGCWFSSGGPAVDTVLPVLEDTTALYVLAATL